MTTRPIDDDDGLPLTTDGVSMKLTCTELNLARTLPPWFLQAAAVGIISEFLKWCEISIGGVRHKGSPTIQAFYGELYIQLFDIPFAQLLVGMDMEDPEERVILENLRDLIVAKLGDSK
jgi:hypothetical protein